MAIHPTTGNVVVVGQFLSSIDFGAGEHSTGGDMDIFIASLGPMP